MLRRKKYFFRCISKQKILSPFRFVLDILSERGLLISNVVKEGIQGFKTVTKHHFSQFDSPTFMLEASLKRY